MPNIDINQRKYVEESLSFAHLVNSPNTQLELNANLKRWK